MNPKQFKKWRKSLGLSQKDAAAALGAGAGGGARDAAGVDEPFGDVAVAVARCAEEVVGGDAVGNSCGENLSPFFGRFDLGERKGIKFPLALNL